MVSPAAIIGAHGLYREQEPLTHQGSKNQKGVKVPVAGVSLTNMPKVFHSYLLTFLSLNFHSTSCSASKLELTMYPSTKLPKLWQDKVTCESPLQPAQRWAWSGSSGVTTSGSGSAQFSHWDQLFLEFSLPVTITAEHTPL